MHISSFVLKHNTVYRLNIRSKMPNFPALSVLALKCPRITPKPSTLKYYIYEKSKSM